jgi:hypothetical protein
MANTINTGAQYSIPFYAAAGTDLSASTVLSWNPTTTTLRALGGSGQFIRNSNPALFFFNQHHATPDTTSFTMTRSRGNYTAQLPVQADDTIGKFLFRANTAAGNTVDAASVSSTVETGSTVSAGSLNSNIIFSTRNGASTTNNLVLGSTANTFNSPLVVNNATVSTSTGTGALSVLGGLGIGGRVITGDNMYVALNVSRDNSNFVKVNNPNTGANANATFWAQADSAMIEIQALSSGNATYPSTGAVYSVSSGGMVIQEGSGDNIRFVVAPSVSTPTMTIKNQEVTVSGSISDNRKTQRYTAGNGTCTVGSGVQFLALDATGMTSLTIEFPPSPVDGQTFTIGSWSSVSGITCSATGKNLGGPITSLSGAGFAAWCYLNATGTWFRMG